MQETKIDRNHRRSFENAKINGLVTKKLAKRHPGTTVTETTEDQSGNRRLVAMCPCTEARQ